MARTENQLDTADLTERVKGMYREVALHPEREFHFATGRPLAEHLGYPAADLDRIPAAAVDSFAGVGYFLDLAVIASGETVLDLGSGSGTDAFLAALAAGEEGSVIGVDMTAEQLAKATDLAEEAGIANAEFRQGQIEQPTSASPATPRCGRRASVAPCSSTATWRRSSWPASRSPRSARTTTASSPIVPTTPPRNTA